MTAADLLNRLHARPLLCDGAMGTQLFAAGLASGGCGEVWNVEKPQVLRRIHRAYIDAGCDLIITNTFGGSATALERHGLADRADDLNRAGAAVARAAAVEAGRPVFVLGDIGPFGGFLEPMGDMTESQLLEIFTRQAAALQAGGADALIVETMSDPAELAVAVRAARGVADWPVIASYAFDAAGDGFRTMMGTSVADAVAAAIDAGATVVGANCGTALSLDNYQRLAAQLVAAAGDAPVILQPNAGAPATIEGRLVYNATAAQMAAIVPALLACGVRILGGCCGTAPAHLAAMRRRMPA